jgi:hypothetical protein
MSTERKEQLGYYRLRDALKKSGCPVCHLIEQSVKRYMDSLLYEGVNDPAVRKKLRNTLGFCNTHAWEMRKLGDGLGQSIIYEDLLGTAEAQMRNLMKSAGSIGRGRAAEVRTKRSGNGPGAGGGRFTREIMMKACPVCDLRLQVEERALSIFITSFGEREFSRLFRDSAGLCLPHVLSVLKRMENDGVLAGELLEIEIGMIDALRDELREFQRKHDYRYADEGFGEERNSWLRAIQKLAGSRGTV